MRVLKVLNRTTRKADGFLEDYRAAQQLEAGALTALKKALPIFKKVASSKDAGEVEVLSAKSHMNSIQEALKAFD